MRRGFTAMELLVALGLSTIVAAAAMSVFAMLPAAEPRLAQRFDDQLDLLITQDIIREAMDTLVAARPLSQEEIDAMREDAIAYADRIDAGEDEDDEDVDGEDDEDSPDEDEAAGDDASNDQNGAPAPTSDLDDEALRVLAEIFLDADRDESVLDDLIVQSALSGPPNFEMHFVENQYENVIPRLELVLHEAPVALRDADAEAEAEREGISTIGRIRGAFELAQIEDEFLLFWQPIDPPGLATVIKDDLAWAEWWVLPRRGDGAADSWNEVHAAYLEREYPLAVRLVLWTRTGEHVDWLFQVEASTPTTRR